ncbi:hypothetical protein RCJ22_37405 [Vibrio sp. FNV 38]|nr:hypothetical protein [Vibrio sp. FNV 38]
MQGIYLLQNKSNPFLFKVGMSERIETSINQLNDTLKTEEQWQYMTHIDGCSWAVEHCILDDLQPLQLDSTTFACSESFIAGIFNQYRGVLKTGLLNMKKPRSIYTISEQIRRDDAMLKNYDKYYIALRLGRYFKIRQRQAAYMPY